MTNLSDPRDPNTNAISNDSKDLKSTTTSGKAKTPKSKKQRCAHPECKKRVDIIGFTCKCNNNVLFCSKHLRNHNCTFDYRKDGQKLLSVNNPVVIASKIDKIN